jgi:hypothetical protein
MRDLQNVMAGLVAAISLTGTQCVRNREARVKPAHDN